jgi:hypothetical protein
MDKLRAKAKSLGATQFGKSCMKNKRYYAIYKGKTINFGSDVGSTFIDHGDVMKKKAWLSRHRMIRNKLGQRVINLKSSASYWSRTILWS